MTAIIEVQGREQERTYVITEERACCLEVQAVDHPDIRVIVTVDFLAVAAVYSHRPDLEHL